LEGRVLVTARKFKELGVGSDAEIEPVEQIERAAREVRAPEMLPATVEEAEDEDGANLPDT
jgi:hypothetical protein